MLLTRKAGIYGGLERTSLSIATSRILPIKDITFVLERVEVYHEKLDRPNTLNRSPLVSSLPLTMLQDGPNNR